MKQLYFCLVILLIAGCKKDPVIITDNDPPYYASVPTVVVQNYVNRLYIDLIGREPLDAEMEADVKLLQENDLNAETRLDIITRLQSDQSYIEGDSSYFHAYHRRFYDLCKIRVIEGASNAEIQQDVNMFKQAYLVDSLNGDQAGMAEKKLKYERLEAILEAEYEYRNGSIGVNEVLARMINNTMYDFINMNTFNFVNATFDDLYFRYPSGYEFNVAFDMIEYNTSGILFGSSGQNKDDYIQIISNNKEFYQGMIIWAYQTLLAREPSTSEVYETMTTFYSDHDFQKVQQKILLTDEYANF